MSASDDKKKKEWAHLNMFRRLLPDFPVGDLQDSESPDFRVKTHHGVLGIEVTSISDTSGRTVEGWRETAVRNGQLEYEERGGPVVYVSFHWANSSLPKGGTPRSLGQKLVALVTAHIPKKEDGIVALKSEELRESGLDDILNFVQIGRLTGLTTTTWISQPGATFMDPRLELVQGLVTKKDEKLSAYRSSCSEVWLLLVAEGLSIARTVDTDALAQEVLESSFDRIYLLDLFRARLYTQQMRRPVVLTTPIPVPRGIPGPNT